MIQGFIKKNFGVSIIELDQVTQNSLNSQQLPRTEFKFSKTPKRFWSKLKIQFEINSVHLTVLFCIFVTVIFSRMWKSLKSLLEP